MLPSRGMGCMNPKKIPSSKPRVIKPKINLPSLSQRRNKHVFTK